MKDNNKWVGGKLLPEYYDTWALFFSKYVDAYKAEGIDIWGFTVENEPHGNGEKLGKHALFAGGNDTLRSTFFRA